MDPSNKALSMVLRKNIKEYEPKKQEALARIQTVTGVAFTMEVVGDVHKLNESLDSSYKDRLGEVYWGSYADNIAQLIEAKCGDDMTKSAFLDATPKRKILIRPTDQERESGGGYQRVSIDDGCLVVEYSHPGNFWTNISEIANFNLDTIL